ncbi:uncharacterized protein LOC129732445 [Wyeomyia smithii]|uniref:uncharacterized protein LOC129732445 n=1 Tax=Wyeomyia smithii TaxID=174621 RepID=UPI00246805C6|nr:uncharacterized protein LOC129732445 [Wyeomyia smithii]XP_055549310.1 uncharacterized protein LOC129732445 [Wyeomyia smithii]
MATSEKRLKPALEEREGCTSCDDPDADQNFVQCDSCDQWWHFTCAGVTDSVNDRAWICSHCNTTPSGVPGSPVLSSDNSSDSVQNNLALLKQRQQLELQRMEHHLKQKFLDEQLEVINQSTRYPHHRSENRTIIDCVGNNLEQEEGALDNQRIPLAAALPTDQHGQHNDTTNKGATSGRAKKTTVWITSASQQDSSVVDMVHNLGRKLDRLQLQSAPSSQALDDIRQQLEQCKERLGLDYTGFQISPMLNRNRYDFQNFPSERNTDCPQPRNLGAIKKSKTTGDGFAMSGIGNNNCSKSGFSDKMYNKALSKSSTIPYNEISVSGREQYRNEVRFCDVEHNIPNVQQQQHAPYVSHEQQREDFARSSDRNNHSTPLSGLYNQQRENANRIGPTSQQIAARQSLARDLPQFAGDPAEWPIFISNYEYTTAACGYTHGENMLRLQRCLKGPAMETVRSRLVLPAAVPQVIEALRRRYGRPELLINALLEKVRKIPAPKADRLEGLIEYGMAVQALCDHIEAANEHVHLSNPMLLQELVGKLPADQKLMWAAHKRHHGNVDLKTLSNYMDNVVSDASSVVMLDSESFRCKDKLKPRGYVNSHSGASLEQSVAVTKQVECNFCGKIGHRL